MTGWHRRSSGLLVAVFVLAIALPGITTDCKAAAKDDRVAELSNNDNESSVYWEAIEQPGGLDEMTIDEQGRVRFASLSHYQDVAPLQPLPLQTAPNTATNTQARPRSVAAIFNGRRRRASPRTVCWASNQKPGRPLMSEACSESRRGVEVSPLRNGARSSPIHVFGAAESGNWPRQARTGCRLESTSTRRSVRLTRT